MVGCGAQNGAVTKNLQEMFGVQMRVDSAIRAAFWDNDRRIMRDTCFAPLTEQEAFKVVAYYNSKGCTSCRLKELFYWKDVLNYADSLNKAKGKTSVEFILLFNPGQDKSKLRDIESSLYVHQIHKPVMIDTKGEFEMQNLLPEDERFHYFLLDKDNKIVLVGSPLGNPAMWELYKKKISEDS